jgi:hypothetical protein
MGLRGVAFLFVLFASAGVADQGASRSFVASFSDQDPPESVARDADVSARTVTLADADKAIEVLRQKTKELTDARSRFLKRLDDTIARYDSGFRTSDGRKIPGADADLSNGPADIMWAGVRRFFAARMLGAGGSRYQPSALAEMDRLQELILDAKIRMDATREVIRRLLVVSVRELNSQKEAEWKARHDQLLRARAALEEAAKQAYASLPVDLPDGGPGLDKERAWDLLIMGQTLPQDPPNPAGPIKGAPRESVAGLPLRLPQGKRTTLLSEPGFRMALTDAGIEDEHGLRLFYQEEWIQRGQVVVRLRWRVGVNPRTGEHTLIKRYEPREHRGTIDELYKFQERDYLWSLEPPISSSEPSRPELESALAQVAQSREQIRLAVKDYRTTTRHALAENDADSSAALDVGLPDPLRDKLFAIRGHLAQVPEVLEAEARVERSVEEAAANIGSLETLAAWGNRALPDRDSQAGLSAIEWERFQNRADDEISLALAAGADARAVLPPDFSNAEGRFPPLQKDVIVHMVRKSSWDVSAAMRCLQEVWRLATSMRGARRVQRTVTLIEVDRETGKQVNVGSSTQYYAVDRDESLEAVYDQFAAQDLSLVLRP